MSYQVTVSRSAKKEISRLPREVAERVAERIDALSDDPRPSGCLKLSGGDDLWRVRVGDYRILYSVDDIVRVVGVESVRHRSDVYRR